MSPICKQLVQICQKQPDQTALVIHDQKYSYNDLLTLGLTWKTALQKSLKNKPQFIGILTEKSIVSYAAVWTSLLCETPFLPIHKTTPVDRIANILNQVQVDVLIVDATCLPILGSLLPLLQHQPVLLTPQASKYDIPLVQPATIIDQNYLKNCKIEKDSSFENNHSTQSELAYILFTSGSTGQPKGVPVTQANLSNYIHSMQKILKIEPTDRLSQTFELTFDLSIFDMFMAWLHGASIYVFFSRDLLSATELINKYNITVWFSVPSVVMLLMQSCREKNIRLPSLRLSLFCGEALSVKIAKFWKQLAKDSKIFNLYGPTELTISCSYFECSNDFLETEAIHKIVPIGKMNESHSFKIIDSKGNQIKEGDLGELCVHGPQMFPGYLEKSFNSKAFIELKDENGQVKSYYRTGDLVYINNKSDLIYKGRIDRQVKYRGYRIELSEIEQVLRSLPRVITAIVRLEVDPDSSTQKLNAYAFGEKLSAKDLQHSLMKKLPPYMIPSEIILMNELTTSVHGKVQLKKVDHQQSNQNLESGVICKA